MTVFIEARDSEVVPERVSVPEQFARLSRSHATGGDVRRAQLATWASDVHVLEELLWQNGLGEAPDPVAQLAALGESVAASLEKLAEATTRGRTARELVEEARAAMVTTFDESVHEILLDQLSSLGHLDACDPLATNRETDLGPTRRLGGRSPEELVDELRAASSDCMAVALVMARENENGAGRRLAHQADVAAFEAYLVAAAVHAGDHNLATVDLRWDLAGDLDPADGDASTGRGGSAFATLRRKLISLVGSAEMEALFRTLEQSEDES